MNELGGDAAIIPKSSDLKRQVDSVDEDESVSVANKKFKIDEPEDIFRTGAKCVPNSLIKDPKTDGTNYHVTGVVRTKPGRGDPTISMSCSDKIAKWLVVGLQGSLLSNFLLKPIYVKAIVVGQCQYNYECMRRALINRSLNVDGLPINYMINQPHLVQSSITFKDSKSAKSPEDTDDLRACHICKTVYFFQIFTTYILSLFFFFLESIMLGERFERKADICFSKREFARCNKHSNKQKARSSSHFKVFIFEVI